MWVWLGFVYIQDYLVCPGLHTAERSGDGIQLNTQLSIKIALMWRGGCIIRRSIVCLFTCLCISGLGVCLFVCSSFCLSVCRSVSVCLYVCMSLLTKSYLQASRKVCAMAVTLGIPTPYFSTALTFHDGYRSGSLPANLIQAQRDYFGAHTYELPSKLGQFIHTNWTGHGGSVSSSTYTA